MHPLHPLLLTLLSLVIFLQPHSFAAVKGKRQAGQVSPPASTTDSPSEQLAPFIEHIDQLLALERPANPRLALLLNGASGRIAVLRQSFIGKRVKADPLDQPGLNAAVATCDAISAALDERQKTLGQIRAAAAVKNSSDLGRRRKDNVAQGVHGNGTAKAVGSIVEARRERDEKRDAQRKADDDDRALTAAAENRWNERSIELRRQITAAYARISPGDSRALAAHSVYCPPFLGTQAACCHADPLTP